MRGTENEIMKARAVLLALLQAEQGRELDVGVFEPLNLPMWRLDRLAWKLSYAGFVAGVYAFEDFEEGEYPLICWERSRPVVTMEGLLWLRDEEDREGEVRKNGC